MNEQNVYDSVLKQARGACAADVPTDANDDQIAAMVAHHGFLICEHGQDQFEATEALVAQDVARRELWGFATPYKPEGYRSADHMIYTLVTQAGRSRSRLSLMRSVGVFCQQAEWWGIETDAAVRNWTNCREVLKHLKNACKLNDNGERLTIILNDVVTTKSRDELREKYKGSKPPVAGVGRFFCVDGEEYFLGHITDGERARATIGKAFDVGDNNGFGVAYEAVQDQIRVSTFRAEKVGGLWEGVLEDESELVPVPR